MAHVGLVHYSVYGGSIRMWNEYHVLYMPFAYMVARILIAFGMTPDILSMMQILNALITACCLFAFARVLQKLGLGTYLSLTLTTFLGFSHFVWYYSTDPEMYPFAILPMLLAISVTLDVLRSRRIRDVVLAGALAGVAFGFHIAAGLLVPGIFVAVLLSDRTRVAFSRRARDSALFFLVFTAVAITPYLIRSRVIGIISYAVGLLQAAMAIRGDPGHQGLRSFLETGFRPVYQLACIVRQLVPVPPRAGPLLATGATIARLLLTLLTLVVVVRARAIRRRCGWVAFILVSWFVLNFLFFSSWNPGYDKFMAFQLIPVLALFGLAAETLPGRRAIATACGIGAIVLAVTNLFGVVIPDSRLENNRDYLKSIFVREHTDPADLVLQLGVGENILQKVYLPYFGQRRGVILDFIFWNRERSVDLILRRLESRLQACWSAGGRVFVLSDVMRDTPELGVYMRRTDLPHDIFVRFLEPYRPRLAASMDDTFGLYILTPPAVIETALVPR